MYQPCVELMGFRFPQLTSIFRSQPENDDSLPNKSIKQSKRSAPPCSGTATSVKGRPLGSPEKVIEGTRDRRLFPAARQVSSSNSTISAAPSGTGSDLR